MYLIVLSVKHTRDVPIYQQWYLLNIVKELQQYK